MPAGHCPRGHLGRQAAATGGTPAGQTETFPENVRRQAIAPEGTPAGQTEIFSENVRRQAIATGGTPATATGGSPDGVSVLIQTAVYQLTIFNEETEF